MIAVDDGRLTAQMRRSGMTCACPEEWSAEMDEQQKLEEFDRMVEGLFDPNAMDLAYQLARDIRAGDRSPQTERFIESWNEIRRTRSMDVEAWELLTGMVFSDNDALYQFIEEWSAEAGLDAPE